MDRREFLSGSLVAATAGLALDACAPESHGVIPILIPEEPFVPGEESFLPSTCFECPAGCGLLVRKIDGRLVKVEGNPQDPASRGGVCARGQALPQAMYHPDRIREPLIRDGERGSGTWKKATWDEAMDRIASEMSREGASFGFLTGEMNGHRGAIVRRFVTAVGGRHLLHEPFTSASIRRAHELATGHRTLFDLGPENASYIVSFGAEILESHTSPVRFARALADMRRGRPGRRGKFVMVGPRLSLTAANADEWIPARPGAELDLALGVASVLLEENLYDLELDSSLSGSSSGLDAFRELLAQRAKVTDVADRTGIREARIERLARELAEHRPAVALAGGSSIRSARGVALALAVSHVNALLGSYRNLEIAGTEPAFAGWPALNASEPARSLTAALSEDAGLPSVLFIADTNPMHSLPPAFDLGARLARSSLIVSFASYPDESSRMADVVLPESMVFERFEDTVPETLATPLARLSGPLLLRPIYDTRSMPDALIALAKRLGRSDSFPWESYEEALKEAWKPLGSWDDVLSRGGFAGERARALSPSAARAKRVAEREPWGWGPTALREARGFATSDRRYRFAVEPIERALGEAAPSELQLHVYPSAAFGDGRNAHLPFLQDLADPITGVRWGSVIEIAEKDAERLSIRSGDPVELRAGGRSLEAPAHVSPGVHPGVVALAAGQGHTGYGRYAEGQGVNAFALFDAASDEDGFLMSLSGIEIRKVETRS